ncbi:MAG: hypothetical protein WBL93_01430 [Lutisporaceae bacterium]
MEADVKPKPINDIYNEKHTTQDENTINNEQPIEDKNLIDEMYELERTLKNPQVQKFTKTTYWNQLSNQIENEKHEDFFQEVLKHLELIEAKLNQIESMLTK